MATVTCKSVVVSLTLVLLLLFCTMAISAAKDATATASTDTTASPTASVDIDGVDINGVDIDGLYTPTSHAGTGASEETTPLTYKDTCPESLANCSVENTCESCHPSCTYCLRTYAGEHKECGPLECITCASGLLLVPHKRGAYCTTPPEEILQTAAPYTSANGLGKVFVINLKRRP